MSLVRLDHYTVRTPDLPASLRFYIEVLGLTEGPRPPFDFPGAWLYVGHGETALPVVHLVGIDRDGGLEACLGDHPAGLRGGTGAVDHIAFAAADWPRLRARCEALGVAWEERSVPGQKLHQVFLNDPTGVRIELNYPATDSNG